MEPLITAEAAGRPRMRLLLALAVLAFAASVLASAMIDEWLVAASVLFAIVVTLGPMSVFEPVSFEVHGDRIDVVYNWRRSSVNLEKVASARIGRWWEIYSRFMSSHYETDFGHLVVLEKAGQTPFDRGWLLSPRDRDGFIEEVEAALVEHRRSAVAVTQVCLTLTGVVAFATQSCIGCAGSRVFH